jgi:hypothetical protein
MLQSISNLELKRELDRRISEIKKLDLSKISLDELINKLTILSGQKRSTIIEDWFSVNIFERKVPSSIDKGDLAVGETYVELKSRFLPIGELEKGVVHKAGQIRLWQQVDAYLFLTSDTEGINTDLYYIPKSKLIELFRKNKIQFSSSHVKGNSALKEDFINSDFSSKIELGISMHNKHYDWSEFKVTVKELKSICQKLRN